MKIRLVLANNGSVARDHLSLERTFLAYIRTSLALACAGVAVVQFCAIASTGLGNIQAYGRPIGAFTVALSIILLVVGVIRFYSVQTHLTRGLFPVSRIFVYVISTFLVALIAVVFGTLVSEQKSY
ncbi:uncharacterized protein BT62DRAFT_929831 [Guyanagaster necrorhizus]|uniref:DUF202 domain-containing protein n=1 Tax=Guyanagaster necrorhizus TaxID=856835 RepID=A0A9P7VYT2_9AGAR|nr:uncharacterized protein BT62DRAFT_929831 [Guyanagaster necrorhizus MCA 3950]KAG7448739.1 hypothetical protein BT62DRAFT_929831 [Guyanagaster necrorhizus MCA 3950]